MKRINSKISAYFPNNKEKGLFWPLPFFVALGLSIARHILAIFIIVANAIVVITAIMLLIIGADIILWAFWVMIISICTALNVIYLSFFKSFSTWIS